MKAAPLALTALLLVTSVLLAEDAPRQPGFTIPQIDLSDQADRQVIVARKSGQYYGQPDTILLADGKTILVGYPLGHGGPDTELRRSDDAGLTWSEPLIVPDNFRGKHNAPTIHRVTDPKGVERLLLVVSHPRMVQSISEDNGKTWSPLAPMFPDEMQGQPGYKGHAPPKSVVRLRDGRYLSMYHDHIRERPRTIALMQIVSDDGGLTWSKPRRVGQHPKYPGAHPCEPVIIRSPDGKQLLVLARENSRQYNSLRMTSDDEGKTWSELRELPDSLNGDRHTAKYTPDGRLFVTFRDRSPKGKRSPSEGDWVGWVGTYNDILAGREGQYRVRLKDNLHGWDCGYPGLELLPDGTFVVTSYGHWTRGEKPYIISVRFKIDELDEMVDETRKRK